MAVTEDALLQHLNQMGAVTHDQLEAAVHLQKSFVASGHPEPVLSDVLIMQGIITPVLKENALKKLEAQEKGGIEQLGQYRLLRKLGEGGMGTVFLAEDTVAQRKLAIKILSKSLADNGEYLTRFRREAKAAGKLNHVNIIGAYGAGEELGHHFYLMEYCEGEPLENRLKRERVFYWTEALDLIRQAAEGLKYAHEQGFVHRDIKPANLFVTTDGQIKILDLGLAKNTLDAESSFQTAAGMAIGTPHYISPEQARGDKNVDGRSDIYSLGATLYHLITGTTMYEGSSAGIIMSLHMAGDVPNPQKDVPDLPDAVNKLIMKMLAKEPEARYANCEELLNDIERALSGKAPAANILTGSKSGYITTKRGLSPVGKTTKVPTPIGMKQSGLRGRNDDDDSRSSGPLSPASKIRPTRAAAAPNDLTWAIGLVGGLVVLAGLYFILGSTKKSESKVSKPEPTVALDPPKTERLSTPPPVSPVVLETPKADPKPQPPLNVAAQMQAASAKTVDLLALTDPLKDTVPGVQASLVGTQLNYQSSGGVGYYWFPYIPPNEYDLRIVATSNIDGNVIAVPLSHAGVEFNWLAGVRYTDGAHVTCFENVRGINWGDNNPTLTRLPEKFRGGRTYTFVIQVRDNKITASIDGRTTSDWPTDFKDISRNSAHAKNGQLGFFGNSWKIQIAEVTELSGFGRKLRDARPPVEKFDIRAEYAKLSDPAHWTSANSLTELVDVKADVVKGTVSKEDKKLFLDPEGNSGRVDLPYRPPSEYDCRVQFMCPDPRPREGNGGDFIIVLPRNGKVFAMVLGGFGNAVSGVDAINGNNYRDNPLQNRTPGLLEMGKRYTVYLAVRENHFTCWLNDKVMVDTPTDYVSWEIKPAMVPVRDKNVMGIGVWGEKKTIYSFEILDVKGKGTKSR